MREIILIILICVCEFILLYPDSEKRCYITSFKTDGIQLHVLRRCPRRYTQLLSEEEFNEKLGEWGKNAKKRREAIEMTDRGLKVIINVFIYFDCIIN